MFMMLFSILVDPPSVLLRQYIWIVFMFISETWAIIVKPERDLTRDYLHCYPHQSMTYYLINSGIMILHFINRAYSIITSWIWMGWGRSIQLRGCSRGCRTTAGGCTSSLDDPRSSHWIWARWGIDARRTWRNGRLRPGRSHNYTPYHQTPLSWCRGSYRIPSY